MKIYKLTYARTIMFTTYLEAADDDEAEERAIDLEKAQLLGTKAVVAKEGSDIDGIFDDDSIWEIEEEPWADADWGDGFFVDLAKEKGEVDA